MTNSRLKRTFKNKWKVAFFAVALIGVLLLVILGNSIRQMNISLKNLETYKSQKESLNDKINFFRTQYEIDSLLLKGQNHKALQLYKEQIQSADSGTRAFAETHLKLAKEYIQTQRKSALSKNYSLELENTEEELTALNDSLMLIAVENARKRDSLNWVARSRMQSLAALRRELKEKESFQHLTFQNPKGNKVFYIGEVEDGKAQGEGVGIWLTGSKYEGAWMENMRHGEGVFEWADGERYEGEYKNDMRHGKGTYYWTNGQKYIGQWEEDRRSGEGTFYDKKGEILTEGIWKDDELVKAEETN